MAFNDGVKTAPIAYIGLVSVIVTFIIVMLLQVLYFRRAGRHGWRRIRRRSAPPAELADLTARQLTQLTRREVVDRDRGVVTHRDLAGHGTGREGTRRRQDAGGGGRAAAAGSQPGGRRAAGRQ